ncbi:MAG: hypothetical protein F6K24_23460 [Okeania sp. SIO2D1]|nr:hypothetical protein [Okeania sp. SIO2D1]
MAVPQTEEIIRKFISILNQESKKPDSQIFPESAWQKLEDLKKNLEQTNDEPKNIYLIITKWCKENQYTTITSALRSVRQDPIKDDEDPPPPDPRDQPITNISLRTAIEDAQENRQQLIINNE